MATPEFIVELRKKIGHDPLLLPAVTAIVVRDVPAGAPIWAVPEVLLVKRADNGKWTPVSGICEPGEEPSLTAVREVKEETGIQAQVEALLGVGEMGRVTYPNGDVVDYIDTAIRLSVVGDDTAVVGDEESTEVGWFTVSQLPPMDPRFRLIIADAVAQLKHPQGFRPRLGFHKRERR
ncbi:NUDIX hydrolase [Corynebacterium sp. A21]|uniref:NUDIX hydrolase n=1 Tax=Corynebacterium sp. A21 TaxID=3457318 RepID=UPI003FD1358F